METVTPTMAAEAAPQGLDDLLGARQTVASSTAPTRSARWRSRGRGQIRPVHPEDAHGGTSDEDPSLCRSVVDVTDSDHTSGTKLQACCLPSTSGWAG